MTFRQSTVRLSIEDDFSAPLEAYATGMAQADEATAAAAAGSEQAAAATDALTESLAGATEAQTALGAAGRSLTEDELAAAAATNEFAQADYEEAVAADEAAAAEGAAAESADAMATANELASTATMALAGAGIAVGLAMGVASKAYDATLGSAVNLDEQVLRLGRDIGASSEDASKLIYVSNVLGISTDTLSRSLDQAINKLRTQHSEGIEPNIDGLAKLSDMYLALDPGVERTQFLLDNFGRSGAQLAPLMELGAAGIKALGDQAQLTGNVLDAQATTNLHNYSLAINQLKTDSSGLGVALGADLAPAAQRVADGGLNLVHTLDMVNAAQKDGIITAFGADITYAGLATRTLNLKDIYYELAPLVEQVNYDMQHGSDASDRAAEAAAYLAKSQADVAAAMAEGATNTQEADYRIMQYGEDSKMAAIADRDSATALGELNKQKADAAALADQGIQQGLADAAMSTAITDAHQSYLDTIKDTQPEIDKLREKIEQETAANGKAFTVVTQGTVSQEDYSLAVARAALAQDKYQVALAGTVDKSGKVHEANAQTLEGLRISAESAQNQVDKLAQKLGSSTTGVADYTTAIADDTDKLNGLTAKQAAAEEQLKRTTGQFILQNLALDMNKSLTPAMALEMEKALGLISDKEYTLAETVLGATKAFDFNKNGVIDAGIEYNSMTKYLADQETQVIKTADAMPPLTTHLGEAGGAAHHAGDDFGYAADQEDRLHDKDITITTTIKTLYGPGGPGYDQSPNNNPSNGGTTGGGGDITTWPGGTNSVSGRNSVTAPAGGDVHIHITGPIHLGAGTTKIQAEAMGAALGRQVRAQILAGSQNMGGK